MTMIMKKVAATMAAVTITLTGMTMVPTDEDTSVILSGITITADAACANHTKDQAIEWAKKMAAERRAINIDGRYGTQCCDLAMGFYEFLVGYHVGGNATDYQYNKLPKRWNRVRGIPKPGDIVVWAGKTRINANYKLNKYGHIGIVIAVNLKKGTMTTVETCGGNGIGANTYTREIKYAAVFIRPAFSDAKDKTSDKVVNKNKTTKYFNTVTVKNKSIVDALKKAGAGSSFSYRTKIYKKNGLDKTLGVYEGFRKQNLKLYALISSGKLIMP